MSTTIQVMTLFDLTLMSVVLGCMAVAMGTLLFGMFSSRK
jgi:hypothetical protein